MVTPGPRSNAQVLELNGSAYFVATPAQASEAGGAGRSWQSSAVQDQGVPALVELQFPVIAYHEGGGFTFQGVDHTYEVADGWDASVPGKIATWPVYQSGEDVTSSDYKGWLVEHQGYLYLLRGRYASKYALDELGGSSWSKTGADHDFGSGNAVAGKPVSLDGKLLVPLIETATSTLQPFAQLTTVGSPDSWDTADAALTAQGFCAWKEKVVYHNGANRIFLAASGADFLDDANWAPDSGDGYPVGDDATLITQIYVHGAYLIVATNRGPFYFDEDLNTRQAIPELEGEKDPQNGIGGGYAHAAIVLPSRGGLVHWVPDGDWANIGPTIEGGYEGDLSEGWGRVSGLVAYGRMVFVIANDVANGVAAMWSFQPPRQFRVPYAPHCHRLDEGAFYEDVIVLAAQVQPVAPYAPATFSDDSAVGTITWSNPSNAGAADASYASALAGTTHYLKGVNPGPNLPDDATLLGVELVVKRSVAAP